MQAHVINLIFSLFSNTQELSESLFQAVEHNDFVKFEKIFDQLQDPQLFEIMSQKKYGYYHWSLFRYAARNFKDIRMLKKMVSRVPELLDEKDDNGDTLLHNLVDITNDPSRYNVTIQWLLEQGAHVNNINIYGHAVIECGLYTSSKNALLLLLLYGSERKPRYYHNGACSENTWLLNDTEIDCAHELGHLINARDVHHPSMSLLLQKIGNRFEPEILSSLKDPELLVLTSFLSQVDRKDCLLTVELAKPLIQTDKKTLRAYAFTHFDDIHKEWAERQYRSKYSYLNDGGYNYELSSDSD